MKGKKRRGFDKMTMADQVLTLHNVQAMMEYALKNSYWAKGNDVEGATILDNCIALFSKDYKYSIIDNENGALCGHYPTRIVLLEYTIDNKQPQNNVESLYDMSKLQTMIKGARSARCRGRFVAPVILFEGKHICRSATLSGGAEIYGRQVVDLFVNSRDISTTGSSPPSPAPDGSDWQMFSIVRSQDIKLLKMLGVGYIFDLMVEKKKVKFGLNVTSSEKVDKENRYCGFNISSIPYPGCEFFRQWKDAMYRTTGMVYDWSQDFVDTQLDIPTNPSPPPSVDWTRYMSWDLVQLTQNYLLLLLKTIKEAETGILVHCISGWDRTPLFISLIRLSLWAEGLIHESLSATEILYLTVAYDWFLFGHKFPDRFMKGEEIFHFCFHFLKYIYGDEFNVGHRDKKFSATRSTDNITESHLLDFDVSEELKSHRASNSSLSSACSSRSVDNPPSICFSVGSCDEEGGVLNAMSTNYYSSTQESTTTLTNSSTSFGKSAMPGDDLSPRRTTSPVAVPKPVHQLHGEMRSASNSCGSWQLIPSFDGTSSPSFTPLSTHSRRGLLSETSSDVSMTHSTRRKNLEEVRRLFLQLYPSISNQSSASWSIGGSGGFSGLLENFAEKVGIRSRSAFV